LLDASSDPGQWLIKKGSKTIKKTLKSPRFGLEVDFFMPEFFFQRCQNQTIDKFPNVGYKSDGFEIPLLVIVAKVIGLNPLIQDNYRLRKNVLPKPSGITWESAFMNPEDYKANVTQNKFLGLSIAATLGLSN
jgi:hypothetical protein